MNSTGGCINGTKVTLKYDNAGIQRVAVMGNKTLRGIGKVRVMLGKGLSLSGDNIIIQNVHITEINPHVIWGGDAIVIRSSRHSTAVLNKIWLDHVKVSRISRQMVVTSGAGVTMTISNSYFDGRTDFSISCDGHHYWTFLFYGQKTAATMLNSYIHGTSGRSPKVGGEKDSIVVVHVANNYWSNNSGHSLDVGENGHVLAEGNYFDNTKEPVVRKTKGALYAFDNLNDDGVCKSTLGRPCEANVLVKSGKLTSHNGILALKAMKAYPRTVDYLSKLTHTRDVEQERVDQEEVEQGDVDQEQVDQEEEEQEDVDQYEDEKEQEQEQVMHRDVSGSTKTLSMIQASDIAEKWGRTTGKFGVGKLD